MWKDQILVIGENRVHMHFMSMYGSFIFVYMCILLMCFRNLLLSFHNLLMGKANSVNAVF